MTDKDGTPVHDDFVGVQRLSFPLMIGKEWHSPQNLFYSRDNVWRPHINRFKVVECGEVTTKAGQFRAFKIARIRDIAHFGTVGSIPQNRGVFWYAPEVRAIVKAQDETARGFGEFELAASSLK